MFGSAPFLAKYAKVSATVYVYLSQIPGWLLFLLTASIASSTMQFLHANDGKEEKARKAAVTAAKDDKVPKRAKGDASHQDSKGKTNVVKVESPAEKRRDI